MIFFIIAFYSKTIEKSRKLALSALLIIYIHNSNFQIPHSVIYEYRYCIFILLNVMSAQLIPIGRHTFGDAKNLNSECCMKTTLFTTNSIEVINTTKTNRWIENISKWIHLSNFYWKIKIFRRNRRYKRKKNITIHSLLKKS